MTVRSAARIVMLAGLLDAAVQATPRTDVVAEWYPNGVIQSVRLFQGGERTGLHRGWWPDGTRRFEGEYRHDLMDGDYRTWHPNGRAAEVRHYAGGREEGVQRMWAADGTLFVNYEAVGGRRFGLVNAKPCVETQGPM